MDVEVLEDAIRKERGLEYKALVLSILFFVRLELPCEVVLYISLLEGPSVFFLSFSSPIAHMSETQARQVLTGYIHCAPYVLRAAIWPWHRANRGKLDREDSFYFYCGNYIDWAR